jgi:GPN-loop GTPase
VAVHLSDCFCLTQPSLYISNILLALRAMLQMDLPHINVLTKIDRIADYDPLPFNLDYYTEVQDLRYLMPSLDAETPAIRSGKFSRLNEAIAGLVENFGLVSFEVLAVENKKSMMHILRVIDRAGGYAFGSAEGANDTVWQVAMRNETSLMEVQDIQERWIDNKAEYDELERREEEEQEKLREEQARAAGEADGLPFLGSASSSGIRVERKKK